MPIVIICVVTAVSWGCHIATGKPWAGKPVTQGAVIYVVGEGGIGVPRRIRAWEQTLNGGSPIDALYRVDCPIFLASPESVQQVIRAARDVKVASGMPVRLIILDTLARCFGGSDENAAKDMGAFIQGCDAIKAATQATVLIIHHSGKDQDKGARGSSAFRAALDVEFNVRREGEGGALILSCTKMGGIERWQLKVSASLKLKRKHFLIMKLKKRMRTKLKKKRFALF